MDDTPARYVLHNLAFRCRTLKEAIAEAEELRKATGRGVWDFRVEGAGGENGGSVDDH